MKPRLLSTALAALICAQSASAASLTWDAGIAADATITAGSGTWTDGAGNWNNGTTSDGINWSNATPDAAIFGGTAGTYAITVGGPISAASLRFNTSGYTLSAASAFTITIGPVAANNTTLASAVSASIGSNVTVTKAANDTITGAGTLNIDGAYVNSQAGNTGGRTLNINGGATVNVNSSGYFGQSAATVYTATNVNGTTIGVGTSAAGGALVVKAGGTVTAGNNTHVVVGLGTAASGMLTIDGGDVNGGAITTLSGGGTVAPANYGGLRLGSTSSTGGTRIVNLNGGNLTVGQVFIGSQAVGSTATNTFNFNGGTLKAIIANTTFMTGLTAANVQVGGAKIDSNNFDITIGQALIHDPALGATLDGGLTKSSAGTLTLTAANTYTGNTTISGGTLKLTGSGRLGSTSATVGNYAGAMSISPGATFEIANGGTHTLSGPVTDAGTLTNSGGGGLILSNAGNSFGALSISNAGSRVFINHATALHADATVNIASGALVFGASATRGNAIAIASGGTLAARAATTLSNVTLPGTGSVIFNNDDAATNLLAISNDQTLTGDLTVQIGGGRMTTSTSALGGVSLSGKLTGGGSLTVTSGGNSGNTNGLFASGVLTLSGANGYTGATMVTTGTLVVDGSTAAGSAVSVGSGGTLGGTGTIGGTLALTGVLAPGDAGVVDIETLNAGPTTWNGGSIWNFDLSSTNNTSDQLAITGDLTKGSGSGFAFNFMGSQPVWNTAYTLATWTGTTDFALGDFSFSNLGAGPYNAGSFSFSGNALVFTAVPEPTSALAGLLVGAGLLRRRCA
jgi:autotransporter-associated beta strand protein